MVPCPTLILLPLPLLLPLDEDADFWRELVKSTGTRGSVQDEAGIHHRDAQGYNLLEYSAGEGVDGAPSLGAKAVYGEWVVCHDIGVLYPDHCGERPDIAWVWIRAGAEAVGLPLASHVEVLPILLVEVLSIKYQWHLRAQPERAGGSLGLVDPRNLEDYDARGGEVGVDPAAELNGGAHEGHDRVVVRVFGPFVDAF